MLTVYFLLFQELEYLIPELEQEYKKLFGYEKIVGALNVRVCHGMDGISVTEEFKESDRERDLPSKVIIGSLRIIDISVETDEGLVLLWRNPDPNSPFAPPTVLALGDENCPFSMTTICQKLDPFFDKLKKYYMSVLSTKFNVLIWQQMDGKMRSNVFGHGGSNTLCNCVSCLSQKNEPQTCGDPRKLEDITRLAIRGQWNIHKLGKSELYKQCMGNERVPMMNSFEPSSFPPDFLHLLINLQSWYEKGIIQYLAHTFSSYKDQEPTQTILKDSITSNDIEKASQLYNQHIREKMNFSRSVQEKLQNPGIYAKNWFKYGTIEQLFKILPDSKIKTDLRHSLNMFLNMKDIMSVRDITEEQVKQYSQLSSMWIQHKMENLSFMTCTNILHIIAVHVPQTLAHPDMKNLFEFSTEGYEANNKLSKEALNARSFRGSVSERLITSMNHRYLVSCRKYRSILNIPVSSYKCSNCGEKGHRRPGCPMQTVPFSEVDFIDDILDIESEEEEICVQRQFCTSSEAEQEADEVPDTSEPFQSTLVFPSDLKATLLSIMVTLTFET